MKDSLFMWLNRVFKTDIKYLVRGGFFLTLTQISSAFIGLGMTIAFANLIPQETFGTYKYILSLYTLFAIGTFPGIDTAVTQSTIHGFDHAYMQGFRRKLSWGILATGATLIFSAYTYFVSKNIELAYLIGMMAFALPLMEAGTVATSYFNGKKKFTTWAGVDVATQVISAGSLVTTMFLTESIYWLLFAYFIPYILTRIFTVFYLCPKISENQNEDPHLYSYGTNLSFFQVATRIISSIDQIILFHFLGPIQVAIFALAQALPTRIQSILRISGSLAFPKFAGKDIKDIAPALLQKMYVFGGIILLGCFIFVATVPYVFEYLLPKYIESIKYSQVLIFYTLSAITYPFGSLLFAQKKIKETYTVTAVNFSSKIIAIIILVPLYGVWGAVYGTVISSFANIAITIYILKRKFS